MIDCYLAEKPTGPHNLAHLDANSDLKIASAIILNKRITTYRVIKFFEMNRGIVAVCALLPLTFIFYLILNVIYFIFVMIKSIKS